MAEKDAEADDYMGDLSVFIPPELDNPSVPSKKSSKEAKPQSHQPSKRQKKLNKGLSWQEQRKIERERQQQKEDEQTLAKCETAIPPSNVGFKLLQQMGYNPGSALGKDGSGRAEPVGLNIRRSRAGLGRESPAKEKARREQSQAERMHRKEEDLMVDFGSRQKMQWRSRRIIVDYDKAKKALAQLENEEILPPVKENNSDEEEKVEEEEEEEQITEEDLQDILMKLRNEHCYCLYCGCQYESLEALSSNCPGPDEEDH